MCGAADAQQAAAPPFRPRAVGRAWRRQGLAPGGPAAFDARMSPILERARQFIAALPHADALGLQVEEIGQGLAVIVMPYEARLIGDPATGVIAGGAVSTLMDTASGAAVMCHPANIGATATLDLRIDYFRPATPGQTIRARAECHHVTRSVAFVRVLAMDDDAARPVAMGTGTFTVSPRQGAPG